jgi:hypothetical protein
VREAQEAAADMRLQALLLEGLASRAPIPIDDNSLDDLRAETDQLVVAHETEGKTGKKSG